MRVNFSRKRFLHLAFDVGVWFKGLDGILEIAGGTLLLLFSKETLVWMVRAITRHELQEDPTDWVATHLRTWLPHFLSTTRSFAGAYLLGHGAIKVFLVWGGLLRRKLWAFPTSLLFIGGFIGYQIYRILRRFSIGHFHSPNKSMHSVIESVIRPFEIIPLTSWGATGPS